METALFGILGVLVGTWLTMWWQHHNWKLQEAMKSYSAMFPAGMREIKICGSLEYGSDFGNDQIIERAKQMQPASIDSPFITLLMQCWLLEKDKGIRSALDSLDTGYKACRLDARFSIQEWQLTGRLHEEEGRAKHAEIERNLERLAKREKKGPSSEHLLKQLDVLRKKVAKKYFR